ncbi:MAG: hypothetical protein WAZ18_00085 [Alphaproteobacteria bacterium]
MLKPENILTSQNLYKFNYGVKPATFKLVKDPNKYRGFYSFMWRDEPSHEQPISEGILSYAIKKRESLFTLDHGNPLQPFESHLTFYKDNKIGQEFVYLLSQQRLSLGRVRAPYFKTIIEMTASPEMVSESLLHMAKRSSALRDIAVLTGVVSIENAKLWDNAEGQEYA